MPNISIPTLVVGVGGFGFEIAGRIYKLHQHQMKEHRQEDWLQFLLLDIDKTKFPDAQHESSEFGIPDKHYFRMRGFDNDFVDNSVKKTGYKDFYARQEVNYVVDPACLEGYNQVRWNGAFGLKASCEDSDLVDHLRGRIASLSSVASESGGTGGAGPAVNIVLAGSMAGGTGSGAILDLAYCIRGLQQGGVNIRLGGLLLLPDGLEMSDEDRWANTYAFLKELNFYMTPLHLRKFDYKMRFGPGLEIDEKDGLPGGDETLFNFGCYFASNHDSTGRKSANTIDGVVARSSTGLYHILTSGLSAITFSNISKCGPLQPEGAIGKPKPTKFGGFSCKTKRIPMKGLESLFASRVGAETIEDKLINPEKAQQWALQTYNELTDPQKELSLEEERLLSLATQDKELNEAKSKVSRALRNSVSNLTLPDDPVAGTVPVLAVLKRENARINEMKAGLEKKAASVVSALRSQLEEQIEAVAQELIHEAEAETKEGHIVFKAIPLFYELVANQCKALYEPLSSYDDLNDAPRGGFGEMKERMDHQLKRLFLRPDAARMEELRNFGKIWGGLRRSQSDFQQDCENFMAKYVDTLFKVVLFEALAEMAKELMLYARVSAKPYQIIHENGVQELGLETRKRASDSVASEEKEHELVEFKFQDFRQFMRLARAENPGADPFEKNSGRNKEELESKLAQTLGRYLLQLVPQVKNEIYKWGGDTEQYQKADRKRGTIRRLFEQELNQGIHDIFWVPLVDGISLFSLMVTEREESFGLEIDPAEAKKRAVEQIIAELQNEMDGLRASSGLLHREVTRFGGKLLKGSNMIAKVSGENGIRSVWERSVGNEELPADDLSDDDDPFAITLCKTEVGYPIAAWGQLATASDHYDTVIGKKLGSKRQPTGLHTNAGFAGRSVDNDSNFELPDVAVCLCDGHAAVTMALAELDWWRDEGETPKLDARGCPKNWDAGLPPLIKSAGRTGSRYTIYSNPALSNTPVLHKLGRMNVLRALEANEDVHDAIRESLRDRWNTRFTEKEKRSRLEKIRDQKRHDAQKAGYHELRELLTEEANALDAMLEQNDLDL